MQSRKNIELVKLMGGTTEDVFQAISMGMLLVSTGIKTKSFEHDFREGGSYTLEWNQGGFCTGRYLKIVANQLVSFSWKSSAHPCATIGETTVTVTLTPQGQNCELRLVHSGLEPGQVFDGHFQGWTESLATFADGLKTTAKTREFPIRN